MRLCPKGGNDKVYTPDSLAEKIVKRILECYPELRYKPVLEPCAGGGAFVRALTNEGLRVNECELDNGVDFLKYEGKVGWIVTNPPWSQIRDFLKKGYEVCDHIFFLAPIPNLMTKARLREMREAGFCLGGMWLVDTPKEFPQSGFQLAVGYFKRGDGGMLDLL